MTSITRLTIDDVRAGDTLPELRYAVSATTIVLGALASRDWRPMHHDHDFAVHRNGTKDIFMNTPNQAAWFERYLTDWSGPTGRLGHMRFRMLGSVFPGDTMTITGTVADVDTDDAGCAWATVDVTLTADDGGADGPRVATTCRARIALPAGPDDNPWSRRGADWRPDPDTPPRSYSSARSR
jgi:acyl dehydratase